MLLSQPAHAEFTVRRLWLRYASGEPVPDLTLSRLAAAYRPAHDVTALARALFTDDAFGRVAGQLVKQPVEWAVGAMRQLGIRPGGFTDREQNQLLQSMQALGQVPFQPPSVGGWPSGAAWLTTFASQTRLRFADFLAAHADPAVTAQLTAVPAAHGFRTADPILSGGRVHRPDPGRPRPVGCGRPPAGDARPGQPRVRGAVGRPAWTGSPGAGS